MPSRSTSSNRNDAAALMTMPPQRGTAPLVSKRMAIALPITSLGYSV
jgi:hypothetical protein